MRKPLVFFIISIFLGNNLNAQWNYWAELTANSTGAYVDLDVSGTAITTNFEGNAMTYDDDNSSVQDIGFTFNFNGVAFTQFVLNSNGFIKFGNIAPSAKNIYYTIAQALLSTSGSCITAVDSNLVYAMNHDLGPAIDGKLPEYRVYTVGTPGSRVCTIQFKNIADKIGGTNIQFSNINFQIKLFEGSNEINFVYGPWKNSSNPTNYIANAVGIKGNSAANSVNVSKSSASEWYAVSYVNGNYWGNPFNIRNSVMAYEPGRTFKFFSKKENDAKVLSVATYGKIALPFVSPHVISASIVNYGLKELINIPVTLTISGANSFSPPGQILSILPGDTALVSFPTFSPINRGINSVKVSVPVDDDISNNSKQLMQWVTNDVCSYVYSDGNVSGVGFVGQTGQLANKFVINTPAAIDQVNVEFLFASHPYNICIWDKSGTGKPGSLLYLSPVLTSVSGKSSHLLPTPVNVTDTFYVGVRQVNTQESFNLAAETETSLRRNTFFTSFIKNDTISWTGNDTVTINKLRFAVEPRLKQVNNGIIKICPGSSTFITSNIIGSKYQWQVDTGSGFNNILNNIYYSDVNDYVLRLHSLPSSFYGYKYRCIVDGKSSNTAIIKFESYWSGVVSSSWEDPANWTCQSVPDAGTDVVINSGSNVTVNSAATCNSIIVNPAATLKISTGATLTVIH